jgi:uncharacterized damage-inducible protein DinB
MRLMIALFAFAALSFGQQPDLKTIPGSTYGLFQLSSNFVLRAAEKMPEEHYSFKPVDNVRSFGELVAHVGDSQYFFCGPVNADGKKSPGIEKTAKTKTAIIAGLKEAFAYCDMAYKQTTDANAATPVSFMRGERARVGVLNFNSVHIYEHYGNLVTYMRMKGLVPPSSEGR